MAWPSCLYIYIYMEGYVRYPVQSMLITSSSKRRITKSRSTSKYMKKSHRERSQTSLRNAAPHHHVVTCKIKGDLRETICSKLCIASIKPNTGPEDVPDQFSAISSRVVCLFAFCCLSLSCFSQSVN